MRNSALYLLRFKEIDMNLKLTVLGVAAAFSFAACETTTNTNANRIAANTNNAVVVNANNTVLTTNTNTTTTNTSSRSTINYNGTSKEYETQRTSVETEAKSAGRTIGTGANDWWLWGKTRSMLTATDDLRESTIDVDVSNAVVTLSGTVANATQKTKAEQTAKAIDGVTKVVNNLKVNASDTALPNTTNTNTHSNSAAH
jgi:hypothetical protein